MNRNRKPIRLTESQLRRVVAESVMRIISEDYSEYDSNEQHSEMDDEFSFSDSYYLGKGKHRQEVIYRGKEIGYLLSVEKNPFVPIKETYFLPDVDYGMKEGGDSLLDGKKGWIDFKRFDSDEEALAYAKANFEEIAYLFQYGDYD